MANQGQNKLEIKVRRIFSEEFKKQKVQLIVEKKIGIRDVVQTYGVSSVTVYRWLYRYSPHHQRGSTQVVQMESEATKTKALLEKVARLEQIVGQKQLQIDYLEALLDNASQALQVDIKKNFDSQPSNACAARDKIAEGVCKPCTK